jgi:hypothetical protein
MGHTSTTMPSGRVLVVGGETCCGDSPLASAEIWHPGRATFIATGDMSQGRMDHSATLLADGSVLVIGGTTPTLTCVFRLGPLEWCERYPRFASVGEVWDPGTGTFSVVPDLHISRAQHSATALADGRILLVGGHSSESDEDGGIVASPMLLDPRDYGLAPAIVRPEAPDAR